MSVWVILVAAGSGLRFGSLKQFEDLGGRRVIDWSIETAAFVADGIVVVLPRAAGIHQNANDAISSKVISVEGGSSRSESVRAGLSKVPESASVVLVHDAARPFASKALFESVIAAVRGGSGNAAVGGDDRSRAGNRSGEDGSNVSGDGDGSRSGADAVVPGAPLVDTIKRVTNQPVENGTADVVETIDRAQLVAVQTPQAFHPTALRQAHSSNTDASDDAGTVETIGGRVVVVPGEALNFKITEPQDLTVARALVAQGVMAQS